MKLQERLLTTVHNKKNNTDLIVLNETKRREKINKK